MIRKIVKCTVAVLIILVDIVIALAAGSVTYSFIAPYTYEFRGCEAFGGEWIIICAAALVVAYAFDYYVSAPLLEGIQNER